MFEWGTTPRGSIVTLYMPGVRVAEILEWAGRLYETSLLERVDDHTLRTKVDGGVTYVPIPPGLGTAIAGLLTIELPAGVRHGQVFKIVVRQITGEKVVVRPPVPRPTLQTFAGAREARDSAAALEILRMNVGTNAAAERPVLDERRILGSFQITVPVTTKERILPGEQRALSVLRWIQPAIPRENRWYFVYERYLAQIAERVGALGGDPGKVYPSPNGDWDEQPGGRDDDRDEREDDRDRRGCVGIIFDLLFGRRERRRR